GLATVGRPARALLHVDAALELGAVGDEHSRSPHVTLDVCAVLELVLVRRGHVARHRAFDLDGAGLDLGQNLTALLDVQVRGGVDLSLQGPASGDVLTALELAVDDDRRADGRLRHGTLLGRARYHDVNGRGDLADEDAHAASAPAPRACRGKRTSKRDPRFG